MSMPTSSPSDQRPVSSPQHASGPAPKAKGDPRQPRVRHYSGSGWSRTPRLVAMAVLGLVVLGGSSVAAVVADLRSQVVISHASDLIVGATTAPKPKDPDDPFKGVPVNIMIIGTDYRDAENAALAGEDGGMRSDTMMWVHISADRTWIQIVSIPRDSMVQGVPCKMPGDQMTGDPGVAQINGSFSAWTRLSGNDPAELDYGAACTISTVIANTGMPVPNHLIVKMSGVVKVVDALDGVDVCLAEPLDQGIWGPLRLDAGIQHLNGIQAMHYVRARHGESGVGDQSDISRMDRQQGFINNVLAKILSGGTLTDVPKMINLTSAVLGSISPDPALADPQNVVGLALSIKDIDRSRIVFTTTPWEAYPPKPDSKIQWSDEADAMWARLAADQPPPDLPALPTPAASASPATEGAAGGGTDAGTGGAVPPADGTTTGETGGTTTDPAATAPATPVEPTPEPSLPAGSCE